MFPGDARFLAGSPRTQRSPLSLPRTNLAYTKPFFLQNKTVFYFLNPKALSGVRSNLSITSPPSKWTNGSRDFRSGRNQPLLHRKILCVWLKLLAAIIPSPLKVTFDFPNVAAQPPVTRIETKVKEFQAAQQGRHRDSFYHPQFRHPPGEMFGEHNFTELRTRSP